jgi:hypothetical protein
MERKLVVHTRAGVIHKGVTHDFKPDTAEFHLLPAEGGGVPMLLSVSELKALFYVKDYIGNRDFVAQKSFDETGREGRRAVVTFADGEEIWGTLAEGADNDDGPGFFFIPSDKEDNNIRIFVVRSAMRELRLVS